jgi:hypothetical protein
MAVNVPLLIASFLTVLAFRAHTAVETRESLAARPKKLGAAH